MRARASRGLFAWIVVSEPSWPVFIACSMSSGLAAAALADDDPVGPHAKRVSDEVADRDRALALDVRRAGLEADDVFLRQLQLGGVLDGDDALALGDERREDVQERRLAGAGAARDEDVQLALDARLEERGAPGA